MSIRQRIRESIEICLEGLIEPKEAQIAAEIIADCIQEGYIDGACIDTRKFTSVKEDEWKQYFKENNLTDAYPGATENATFYKDQSGNIVAQCYYGPGFDRYIKK